MADKHRGRGAPRHGGWWFLAAIVLLYLIVGWLDPRLSAASFSRFVSTTTELLPVFGVMFLLLWLFNRYARPGQVVKHLGRAAGMRAWLFSIGAGILSIGPAYLWYPVLGTLRSEGLRPGLAAAFLYSRAIKIPMLPLMAYYFGMSYATLFVVCVLLFSAIVGAAMERWEGQRLELPR